MLRNRKYLVLAVALIMMASLLVAGCQPAEEQVDNSLERVKNAGEITFSMSGGYPPFNFYNDENQLVGFDIDVCEEIASRLDVGFKPVPNEWSGIVEGLRSSVYDGILGSMDDFKDHHAGDNFWSDYRTGNGINAYIQ